MYQMEGNLLESKIRSNPLALRCPRMFEPRIFDLEQIFLMLTRKKFQRESNYFRKEGQGQSGWNSPFDCRH